MGNSSVSSSFQRIDRRSITERPAFAALAHSLLPAGVERPSDRQRLFTLFFTGTLIDLVVLGLFAQFTRHVYVASFAIALLASIVLQVLLKLTIVAEHLILGKFEGKTGAGWKTAKITVGWVILIVSKFVILGVITVVFAGSVRFIGVVEGVLWLITVALTMIAAEELVARIYRRLA